MIESLEQSFSNFSLTDITEMDGYEDLLQNNFWKFPWHKMVKKFLINYFK